MNKDLAGKAYWDGVYAVQHTPSKEWRSVMHTDKALLYFMAKIPGVIIRQKFGASVDAFVMMVVF